MSALDIADIYERISRRRFLAGAAALTSLPFIDMKALAQVGQPARFTQGDFDIAVISDGSLVLPLEVLAPDATPQQRDEIAAAMGWADKMAHPATNIPLIRIGDERILVDIGSGDKFQPESTGELTANLAAAGVDPASITGIVFTHAHPDHIWATVMEDGGLRFANASYYVGATEWDFWMNPDIFSLMPDAMHDFARGAQRDLEAVEDRMTRVKAGDTIVAGLSVLDTPGHTPGHISLEVAGGEGMIITGDVMPNEIISLRNPDWKFGFDADPETAIATRRSLVDRAATDGMRLLGYHFTYPGVGMVEKDGTGYRFIAA